MTTDIAELVNRGWCVSIEHRDQPGCIEMTVSRGAGEGRIDSVVKQVAAMCEIAR